MAVERTRVVNDAAAVQVSSSGGEHLFFRVTAVGPIAIFAFASNVRGTLHKSSDFPGHPTTSYEWVHLRNPSDIQQVELLSIVFSFLTSARYEYLVELRDSSGEKIQTVLQVMLAGSPTDTHNESFTVIIV